VNRVTIFILSVLVTFPTALLVVFLLQSEQDYSDQVRIISRSEDEQRTIDIYRLANEGVVFISTVTLTFDPFDFLPEVQPREGSGSGVIVDSEQGIILTNLHVIQDAHTIEIVLADGQGYKARLLGHDAELDLAVIQLVDPPSKLIALDFGDSNSLEVGQRVLAIGNPHGLERTLTSGIVSSLNRTVRNPNNFLMKGLIQTDAAINPGNSGGPLIDLSGRLVGLNTAILSRSGDSAGIGFAVPINHIRRVLPELIATGRVLRPKFGWLLVDTNQGPMVRRVAGDGPAARAGVQPIERPVANVFFRGFARDFERADLIVAVNGRSIRTSEEINDIISELEGAEPVRFLMRTGGIQGPSREIEITPILQ